MTLYSLIINRFCSKFTGRW